MTDAAATQTQTQTARQPAQPASQPGTASQSQQSAALARVEAVKGTDQTAAEQVAQIVAKAPTEKDEIMTWLHKNRGNAFVQQIVQQMQQQPNAPAETPAKKSTKYPIVLLHGFGAGPGSFDAQIPAEMRQDGDQVFETTVPPYNTPEARAKILAPQLEQIMKSTGATKLNLIAWSEGGLDARYLISSMGWSDKIASLSMLGTPNRGSNAADVAGAALGKADKALDVSHDALDHIQQALALIQSTAKKDGTFAQKLSVQLTAIASDIRGMGVMQDAEAVTLDTLAKLAVKVPALAGEVASKAASLAQKLQQMLPKNVETPLEQLVGPGSGNPMAGNANVPGALASLSEQGAAQFNQQNPNKPGVYYQSWAGVATPNGKLTDAQIAQLKAQGPMTDFKDPHQTAQLQWSNGLKATNLVAGGSNNLGDGAVPVTSAEWGNFRGEIPADHMDLVNASPQDKAQTDFDTGDFYRDMARDLAKRGD